MSTGDSDITEIQLQQLEEQGYTLIPDFLSSGQLQQVNALYDTMLGSHQGRNNFEGNLTERIYTLVARHRIFQDIVEDARVMALCDIFFQPNYLLTASQAIVISPGETPQPWHTDDYFYPVAGRRIFPKANEEHSTRGSVLTRAGWMAAGRAVQNSGRALRRHPKYGLFGLRSRCPSRGTSGLSQSL